MSDPIIQVTDVSKSYGGVKANVDITFGVERGSITGIIGPNGCGKTTLFNSIVGYHPIDNGSIKFDGQEISHLLVGDIARLGMLRTFQQTRKLNSVVLPHPFGPMMPVIEPRSTPRVISTLALTPP